MRRTKIVCTLGPATSSKEKIKSLILAGMNVARFNFSHGDHAQQLEKLQTLREVSRELGIPVASLLDTKGPEIRLGKFENGGVDLEAGDPFTLTTESVIGTKDCASISYEGLPNDVTRDSTILLDDGLIELRVTDVAGPLISCVVVNGGHISNRKGVNVPQVDLTMPYISPCDRADILFGIEQGFDFIAASFCRSAEDILDIRKILDSRKCDSIRLIAKIENAQGVDNIDEILKVSDGVMIARGDMGVEIPLEDVPVLQKMLIKKAYNEGKQVITATQMLDSMMKNPRPTRAESTDVANAIYDGTSAIMLSGETAAGAYPIEAVKTMAKIAERAEKDIDYKKRFFSRTFDSKSDVTNAISHATCTTAHDLGASAIITVTKSGQTVRMISKYRPEVPIIGCSPVPKVCRQMNMSWGVTPLLVEEKDNTEDLFNHAVSMAQKAGLVKNGDLVVITAGVPLGISGTTNMLKVHVVGDILVSGEGVNAHSVCGNVCLAHNEEEALANFRRGDILVIPETTNRILPLLKLAKAIVTEKPGLNSHAAIVGLTLDLPVIVGARNATDILKQSTAVTVDAGRGIVCRAGSEDIELAEKCAAEAMKCPHSEE